MRTITPVTWQKNFPVFKPSPPPSSNISSFFTQTTFLPFLPPTISSLPIKNIFLLSNTIPSSHLNRRHQQFQLPFAHHKGLPLDLCLYKFISFSLALFILPLALLSSCISPYHLPPFPTHQEAGMCTLMPCGPTANFMQKLWSILILLVVTMPEFDWCRKASTSTTKRPPTTLLMRTPMQWSRIVDQSWHFWGSETWWWACAQRKGKCKLTCFGIWGICTKDQSRWLESPLNSPNARVTHRSISWAHVSDSHTSWIQMILYSRLAKARIGNRRHWRFELREAINAPRYVWKS